MQQIFVHQIFVFQIQYVQNMTEIVIVGKENITTASNVKVSFIFLFFFLKTSEFDCIWDIIWKSSNFVESWDFAHFSLLYTKSFALCFNDITQFQIYWNIIKMHHTMLTIEYSEHRMHESFTETPRSISLQCGLRGKILCHLF